MPILNRLGKDKVINHHQKVLYRVPEKSYTHGAQNSGTMIIRGDNLDALKALLPKYEGRVKCIYIDQACGCGKQAQAAASNAAITDLQQCSNNAFESRSFI